MYPTKTDNIVAFAKGPVGPEGGITQDDIDALIGGAPADGDTLKKLYDLIAAKAPLDGAELTNAEATTQALGNDSNLLATTAFVKAEIINQIAEHVSFDSPEFTGVPKSVTAPRDTNTTQIATTAFVLGQASSSMPAVAKPAGAIGTSKSYARADHVHPGRELLTSNRTYYVRKDGADSNDGLADTAGGAFLTIQKALDTVFALDLSIYSVTIQVRAGTYAERLALREYVGIGPINLVGDATTPSNVVVSATSGACLTGSGHRLITVNGFKLQTTTSGEGIQLSRGASLNYQNIDFGSTVYSHVYVASGAVAQMVGPCTISGGAPTHINVTAGGYLNISSRSFTLTGTPAFSSAFALVDSPALLLAAGNTFTGSATGKRYDASLGGVINTAGGGANYFPGNSAGTATTGQYA